MSEPQVDRTRETVEAEARRKAKKLRIPPELLLDILEEERDEE